MNYEAMRIGYTNWCEDAVLTCTPEPVTDAEELKNEYRARLVKFTDLTGDIVIEGVFPEPRWVDYFALPDTNLGIDARVKVELFETDVSTTDLLGLGFVDVSNMKPLGLWRYGVDAYGGKTQNSLQGRSVVQWFNGVLCRRFKLTIEHGIDTEVTEPVYDEYLRQDEDGVFCIEAENCEFADTATDSFPVVSWAGASGGQGRRNSSGQVYAEFKTGPSFWKQFRASKSGVHDIYFRGDTDVDCDSTYVDFDGDNQIIVHSNAFTSGPAWIKARTCNLVAEQVHQVKILARDAYGFYDKIVIQPTTSPAPTGDGPAESTNGIVGQSGVSVSLRCFMLGEAYQLQNNFSYGGQSTFVTDPQTKRSFSGFAMSSKKQHTARRFELAFEGLSDADRMRLVEIEMGLAGKPFVVSAYPSHDNWTADAFTMLARFETANKYSHRWEDMHQTTMTFAEV